MIQAALQRAFRRLGARYPRAALLVLLPAGGLVVGLPSYGIMALYIDMNVGEFFHLLAVEEVVWVVDALIALRFAVPRIEPSAVWLGGKRDSEATLTAWRAVANLPLQLLRYPLLYVSAALLSLGWDVYSAWVLGLPAYSVGILFAGCFLTYLYWVFVRFLGTERALRPVLERIGSELPDEAELPAVEVPLRGRLIATLPALVVMTGAVVPGITFGDATDVERLGVGILAATVVAVTVAIPLIDLLSDSVVSPIAALERATERVRNGDLETRVPVFSTDETGNLARSFNEMVAGLAERERIREAFGTYVDREVAEHILREGTDLAGEEVEVTMMFIDIRDFTGFAERSTAPNVVATLNRLFERIVPVIHEHGGHVDKFVGDGLLAVFGAPRRQADHADHALAAALEIERAVREEFGGELGIGIGLNSGTVVAGNVGGAGRLEFSVIGDAVNVAARVEAATRQTGDTILVAEETTRLLGDSAIPLEERPAVSLKGKRETVTLYAPEAARDRGDDAISLER
jgi:adenylate cyclase